MFKLSEVKAKANSLLDGYKQKDPATYAAAQEAVGGLLILDGFIGIDNPFGGKKRPGIFGSLTGVVLGIVFIVIGFFGANLFGLNNYTAQTNATVVSVSTPSTTTTDSSGNTSGGSCSMTARYTVNGKAYTTASSMSSSSYCGKTPGSSVTISYNPNEPGKWATDIGMVKNIIKIFGFAGILVVLASLVTFTIRLLSIIFGWKLLKSGRALAKTLPGGSNLGSLVSQIREEFRHTLFNGPGAATASTLQTAIQDVVNHEQATAAPVAPAQPVQEAVQTAPAVVPAQPVAPVTQPASTVTPIAPAQALTQPAPAVVPVQDTTENTPPTPPAPTA